MAHLTQTELLEAIEVLAAEMGLQRLRDRFVRLHALVNRKRITSANQLADQLYMLSGSLRRQVPATFAFHAVWGEALQAKIGEEGEQALEAIAERVNACLGPDDSILPDRAADLDAALAEYQTALAAVVGEEMARLDMLLKAVPAIADKLRAAPTAAPPA